MAQSEMKWLCMKWRTQDQFGEVIKCADIAPVYGKLHDLGPHCWCGPDGDINEDGILVFIHRVEFETVH